MDESENTVTEQNHSPVQEADLFGYGTPVKKAEDSSVSPEIQTPKPVSYPEEETPAPKPVTYPEEETPAPKPVTYPEEETPAPKPVTYPEAKTEETAKPEPVRFSAMDRMNLPKDASIGTYLREGRRISGLTVAQVSDATFINPLYIEALESDKSENMPALVFVKGYVRRMGELYGFDPASLDMLNEKLNDLERKTDVPEKLLQNIEQTGQINEAEMKRMKMMLIYTLLIAFSLISLICTTVFAIYLSRRSASSEKTNVSVEKFDSSKLEKLMPVQMPELKLMDSPAQAKKK